MKFEVPKNLRYAYVRTKVEAHYRSDRGLGCAGYASTFEKEVKMGYLFCICDP